MVYTKFDSDYTSIQTVHIRISISNENEGFDIYEESLRMINGRLVS